MIIGSERLDAFCRALDNFLDNERDGNGKAVDLVCELAQKVGVPTSSIWHVYHAWNAARARRRVERDIFGRVILDFAFGFESVLWKDIAKSLHFWGVDEFTYSCKAGGAQDACFALCGDEYCLDGISQISIGMRIFDDLTCEDPKIDHAFHFSKIKQ